MSLHIVPNTWSVRVHRSRKLKIRARLQKGQAQYLIPLDDQWAILSTSKAFNHFFSSTRRNLLRL